MGEKLGRMNYVKIRSLILGGHFIVNRDAVNDVYGINEGLYVIRLISISNFISISRLFDKI